MLPVCCCEEVKTYALTATKEQSEVAAGCCLLYGFSSGATTRKDQGSDAVRQAQALLYLQYNRCAHGLSEGGKHRRRSGIQVRRNQLVRWRIERLAPRQRRFAQSGQAPCLAGTRLRAATVEGAAVSRL